ncbi:hypothetical protein FNV43_RR11798 [Rhamnella rubrinervis]|uniref:Uncharacterized protein n=1 Tax=Rhamnella rubrinervis TaxID=2594499 RepID=A0A8K0MI70_9ROSA|nr:hypothetical protein FNV43_RR11798 [Rhamnella rubrinervis]
MTLVLFAAFSKEIKTSSKKQANKKDKERMKIIIPTKSAVLTFSILLSLLVVNTVSLYTDKPMPKFDALGHQGRSRGSGSGSQTKECNVDESNPTPMNLLQCSHSRPSPSPSSPEHLVFADRRLALVYPVIQNFKSIITSDPLGVTKSWVGSDVCNYKGFYCDHPPDNKSAIALASIDFNGFKLGAPTLDGFLDQLPDIALFHANSNYFAGSISSGIAKLPYLFELDISNNKFSGPFPSAVLGMKSLTFLDIRFNSFSGSVPPQIFTQNLNFLFINNNDFMQKLPDNLGSSHILYLTLANNKFMGPIPRSIAKVLSSVTEVLLLNNQLTGCLPYEIGFIKGAIVFDIGNNRLTGPLPFSLACLDKVEQLNFAGNLLYGMVPEVVCQLEYLANFSLSNNYFTTVGPICRSLIERGVLDVRNNCIPDLPYQRSVVDCAAFFAYPRFCPYMWSYTYIPCMFPGFTSLIPQMAPTP